MSENPRLSLGAQLLLLILYERHPEPVPRQELNDTLKALLREHGSVEKALEFMKQKVRKAS